MKIKIIADGSTKKDREEGRWGFAALAGKDILFDTFCDGEKLLFLMKRRKIDPVKIKHIVISHRHWDHTGGLWKFLEINNGVTVYLCRHSPAGLINKVRKYGAKVRLAGKEPLKMKPGAVLTGEIKVYYKSGIIYEQGLIIKAGTKTVLLCGCSHPGPEKMLEKALESSAVVDVIAGGFHLMGADAERITRCAEFFRRHCVKNVLPLHCSGKEGKRLNRYFKNPSREVIAF